MLKIQTPYLKKIKEVFISCLPKITHTELEEGDHMAPINHSEKINALIYNYLRS